MRSFVPLVFACVSAVVAPASVRGADLPIPDPGFGDPDGIARIAFDIAGEQRDTAAAATALANGRLVLAGTAEVDSLQQDDIAFARLTATDGTPDPDFGANNEGRVLAGLAPVQRVADIQQTADGLLYLGVSSDAVALIGRIDADGAADPDFNGNGHRFLGAGFFVDAGAGLALSRIIALPGGKILVAGYANSATDVCAVAARLNADGSTDTTFGAGSGRVCVAPVMQTTQAAGAFDAAVLADGRILLAGVSAHPGGSGMDMSVARLAPDGALDLEFGPAHDGWAHVAFDQGGTLWDGAYAIAVDADERIVLAGQVETQSDYDIGVARLLPDGTPDPVFGSGGRVQIAFDLGGWNWDDAHSVYVLPDRHILIGGRTQVNSTVGVAVMLRSNGELERRFGNLGKFVQADPDAPESEIVNAERMLLDGDYMYMVGNIISPVLLPGSIRNYDFAATRYVIPLFSDGFDAGP